MPPSTALSAIQHRPTNPTSTSIADPQSTTADIPKAVTAAYTDSTPFRPLDPAASLSETLPSSNLALSSRTSTLPSSASPIASDAEGSLDVGVDDRIISEKGQPGVVSADSSSDRSIRPGKRRVEEEDNEYFRNNPELYGLRRSVSSRVHVYIFR